MADSCQRDDFLECEMRGQFVETRVQDFEDNEKHGCGIRWEVKGLLGVSVMSACGYGACGDEVSE